MKNFRNKQVAMGRGVWWLLCLSVVLVVMASACSKDDKEDERLEVSPENIQLDDNGQATISITSNAKWSINTSVDWLMFSTMSGVGNGQVTVSATGTSSTDRMAIVGVKGEGLSRQVVVTQKGKAGTPSEPDTPSKPDNPSEPTASSETFNVGGVAFKMIHVEGGTFWMGATAEQLDDAYDSEKPMHQVTLSSYDIGETEVTQQLWQVVMGQKPTSGGDQWDSTYGLGSNRPAYYVSWDDCQEFIAKLNSLTGKNFRLPTEAEWEFAARGGTKSRGCKYSGSNAIGDVAWYRVNSYDKGSSSSDYGTHDVATKQPNELGLFDMTGNVWEWCNDWYADYISSSQTDPRGPSAGSGRVFRGGSWDDGAGGCRVSSRLIGTPDGRVFGLGLRLAL